ncbi:MAG: TonB-dependent receptor plug domain-containing protein [Ignavibacteria bacterium]
MTKTTCSLLLALPILLVGPSVHAAGDDLDQLLSLSLEELMATKVTISTSTEQSLARAPSVVSVITAEDIKATGATNVIDVLQTVPGVYVRMNLFGFRPQITFRGANGTHTLLMVNGEPIRDLVWSSGIFWKGLPTSMVERIEVIRGPGSALFGSDASAGVINIITKTAAGVRQAEASARAGSFDTREGWAQYGGNWNGIDIALTAQMSRTDGHNPAIPVDGQTSKDAAYLTNASHAPGHAYYGYENQDLRFSAGLGSWRLLADFTRHSNLGIGLTGAGVLDPGTRGSDSRSDLALLYDNQRFAAHWGLSAEMRYYQLDYTSGNGFYERPDGYTDASGTYPSGYINRMRSAQRGYSAEVSGRYAGMKSHDIKIGAGHKVDDLYFVQQLVNLGVGPTGATLPAGGPLVDVSDTPYAFAPERARRISYVFLQDVWTIASNWELTAGARYDNYSDFGGTANPRVALVWQTTERLVTKLMYGRAFRAPSYLELYSQTAATKPNPGLTPERSRTWDLSLSYSASRDLKLGADFYRFAQTNLIAADASNQFQNMGNNTVRGIELEAQWQATRTLRLSGNATHRSESIAFNSIPRQKAYLRADWNFAPGWNWNMQVNRIGARPLPTGDVRAPLGAYSLVDTTVRFLRLKEWELAASIRNLTNVDAREYSSSSIPMNLPLPGRNFYAEARYRF